MSLSGRFEWPMVMLFVILAAFSRSPALIVLAAGGLVVWLVVWLTARVALVAQTALPPDPSAPFFDDTVLHDIRLTINPRCRPDTSRLSSCASRQVRQSTSSSAVEKIAVKPTC